MVLFAVNPRGLGLFEDRALADFKQRLMAHVLQLFPTRARQLGEARVRQIIDRSIAVADRSGLRSEREVARYVMIGVAAGDELVSSDHAAWAEPVLGRREWSGERKIARLQAEARRHGLSFADPGRT